jgi:hypothetical protein
MDSNEASRVLQIIGRLSGYIRDPPKQEKKKKNRSPNVSFDRNSIMRDEEEKVMLNLDDLTQSPHQKEFNVLRHHENNMVSENLLYIWRNCLTSKERFLLWFKHFNAFEKVRLWNRLVFAREWFRRTVRFSKELEQKQKQMNMGRKEQDQDEEK